MQSLPYRTLVRFPALCVATGRKPSAQYQDIAAGLFTKGVSIGRRAVGWPSDEVDAIITARVAGWSDTELKQLVQHLHDQRKTAAARLLGGAQ